MANKTIEAMDGKIFPRTFEYLNPLRSKFYALNKELINQKTTKNAKDIIAHWIQKLRDDHKAAETLSESQLHDTGTDLVSCFTIKSDKDFYGAIDTLRIFKNPGIQNFLIKTLFESKLICFNLEMDIFDRNMPFMQNTGYIRCPTQVFFNLYFHWWKLNNTDNIIITEAACEFNHLMTQIYDRASIMERTALYELKHFPLKTVDA